MKRLLSKKIWLPAGAFLALLALLFAMGWAPVSAATGVAQVYATPMATVAPGGSNPVVPNTGTTTTTNIFYFVPAWLLIVAVLALIIVVLLIVLLARGPRRPIM